MKKLLIGVAIVAVLVAVVLVVVFQMTSGIVDVADNFFAAAADQDYETAYTFLSSDFKTATTMDELKQFLAQSAVGDYSKGHWSSRSVSGGQGELEGEIETRDGGSVPIKVTLVKEEGNWKILTIQKDPAGLIESESSGTAIPDQQRLTTLTDESMHDFALAVNERDFGAFHNNISALWKSQISKDELYDVFKSFSEREVDLTVLEGMTPVFSDEPYIDDNGVLRLVGYYPTQPSVTNFRLSYLYEHPEWKLAGINVRLE